MSAGDTNGTRGDGIVTTITTIGTAVNGDRIADGLLRTAVREVCLLDADVTPSTALAPALAGPRFPNLAMSKLPPGWRDR
jgi:hypothetical protein